LGSADEVPIAIDDDPIANHTEPIESSSGRQLLSSRHAQLVALSWRSVANSPCFTPTGDAIKERLSFGFREEL
jgi:hypothetical protein